MPDVGDSRVLVILVRIFKVQTYIILKVCKHERLWLYIRDIRPDLGLIK